MELRSFDRAWTRLKPLLESPTSPEPFHLAGRLLTDRGDVHDARKTLTRGRSLFPDDEQIESMLAESEEPRTQLDLTDPLDEDPDGQARLAERLLIQGAPLRARRLLEKVRRSHPDHTRTADLLWALDGNFRLRGVTLADLARVHAAPTQSLADLPEDTDFTAEASVPPELADEEDSKGAAFPTLFKNLEEQTEAFGGTPTSTGEREVTQATQVSSILAGETQTTQTETQTTDGRGGTDGREDTQIMHVVRTTGHQPDGSSGDTLIDGAFDLGAAEQALQGETEDEDIVLRRRSRHGPADTDTQIDTQSGRIHLDPSRDRVQEGANIHDEGAEFIRPRKKPQVTVEPAPPRARKTSDPPGQPRSTEPQGAREPDDDATPNRAASDPPKLSDAPTLKRMSRDAFPKHPPTDEGDEAGDSTGDDEAPTEVESEPSNASQPSTPPRRSRAVRPSEQVTAPASAPPMPAPEPRTTSRGGAAADADSPTQVDSERPRLSAAPSRTPRPPQGVRMERLDTSERPKLDPRLAAAPTVLLDDETKPPRRSRLAPWTGWLLVLTLIGLVILSMGSLLILYQLVSSV